MRRRRRGASFHLHSPSRYLSPGSISASNKLYVRLPPPSGGALLMRKGDIFVCDGALLSRYSAHPASRGAPSSTQCRNDVVTTSSRRHYNVNDVVTTSSQRFVLLGALLALKGELSPMTSPYKKRRPQAKMVSPESTALPNANPGSASASAIRSPVNGI